jgi:hypothetical protein
MKRLALAICTFGFTLCLAGTASAQFVQYATSGGVNFDNIPDQEAFDQAMNDALWRGGRWFADPWIGIRSLGYSTGIAFDSDGETGEGDTGLQASGGAGVRIYRPIGSRGTWATHALPEYTWFENGGRSRVNGRFGTGLFANLGGFLVQATARREDQLDFFSRQVEDQISQRHDEFTLSGELGLVGSVSLHVQGQLREYQSLEDQSRFDSLRQLDREETSATAGLRFRSSENLMLGFGAGVVETQIAPQALPFGLDRSSDGNLIYVELSRPSDSFNLQANIQLLQLDFTAGPTPLELDEVTGQVGLNRRLSGRFAIDAYVRRTVGLALGGDFAYFLDDSVGVGMSSPLGAVGAVRIYGETGTNDYRGFADSLFQRQDDYVSYGLSFQVRHRSGVGLYLDGRVTDYDSNIDSFDRDITTVRGGLNIGLNFGLQRGLVFGNNRSPWV